MNGLRIFACVVLLAWRASNPAAAANEPSAAVTTQLAIEGDLPQLLTAYGTAVAATNGAMTLSLPVEGRVTRLLATAGESVHKGQPLLDFERSASASAAWQQATSALQLARSEQARLTRMLAQQTATRDQKAQADKAVIDAQATLDASNVETGGASRQTLTAPFDGVISALAAAQGDRVAAGAPLLTLVRSSGVVVTVGIEPIDRSRVKPGQEVEVHPLSDESTHHAGRVVRVDHSINPKSRLVDVDVTVDDPLLLGESFRAEIGIGQLHGWIAPRDAVLDDDDGTHVYQVANGKAVRIDVKRIGNANGKTIFEGALDPAHALVIQGNYELADGMPVRESTSAAASETPAAPAKPSAGGKGTSGR